MIFTSLFLLTLNDTVLFVSFQVRLNTTTVRDRVSDIPVDAQIMRNVKGTWTVTNGLHFSVKANHLFYVAQWKMLMFTQLVAIPDHFQRRSGS